MVSDGLGCRRGKAVPTMCLLHEPGSLQRVLPDHHISECRPWYDSYLLHGDWQVCYRLLHPFPPRRLDIIRPATKLEIVDQLIIFPPILTAKALTEDWQTKAAHANVFSLEKTLSSIAGSMRVSTERHYDQRRRQNTVVNSRLNWRRK